MKGIQTHAHKQQLPKIIRIDTRPPALAPRFFLGYERELMRLKNQFAPLSDPHEPKQKSESKPKIVHLTGFPGIGKTALSWQLAEEPLPFKVWFSAKNYLELLAAYRNFIDHHVPGFKGAGIARVLSPQEIITIMQQWFERFSNWLAIFDGIQDFDDLFMNALPQKGKGRVLLNSVHSPSAHWVGKLAISIMTMDRMSPHDAGILLHLLLSNAPTKSPLKCNAPRHNLVGLAKQMGFLPLALIKYAVIAHEFQEPHHFFIEFHQTQLIRLIEVSSMPTGYQPRATLLEILKNHLNDYYERTKNQDHSYVQLLLRFCAFLHFGNISVALLKSWESLLYPVPQECLPEVLKSLKAAHLIQYDTERILISPLVQAVIRHGLSLEEKYVELKKVYIVLQQLLERDRRQVHLLKHTKMFQVYQLSKWDTAIRTKAQTPKPGPQGPLFVMFLKMDAFWNEDEEEHKHIEMDLQTFHQMRSIPAQRPDSGKTLLVKIGLWDRNSLVGIYDFINYLESEGKRVGIVMSTSCTVMNGKTEAQILLELQALFDRYPIISKRIIGMTQALMPHVHPKDVDLWRGTQIESWLLNRAQTKNDLKAFVTIGYGEWPAPNIPVSPEGQKLLYQWHYTLKNRQEREDLERIGSSLEHKEDAVLRKKGSQITPANFFKEQQETVQANDYKAVSPGLGHSEGTS